MINPDGSFKSVLWAEVKIVLVTELYFRRRLCTELNSFGNTDRSLNGRKSNFITPHMINLTASGGMSDRLPAY